MKFYLELAWSERLLSQLCSSQIASSTVALNVSHSHANLPAHFQAPICFTSFSAHPFLLPTLPSCPLSLVFTDQGSVCSVSISHVSFFSHLWSSDLGSGTAQQRFFLPTGAQVFWLTLPLISLKSETHWWWSSYPQFSLSPLAHTLPADWCENSTHTNTHIEGLF